MKRKSSASLRESCAFITGRHSIDVSGCIGIRSYAPDRVILTLEDGEAEIEGCGLSVSVFAGSEIRLSGALTRITLSDVKGVR